MTRLHKQVLRLAAALAGLLAVPALASAQRPLVYCPVGIDETGCSAVVNALGAADRAFDGSMGTVDLRTADLGAYTVLVIPSLADDGASQPYALLRDAQVAARLRGLLLGRRVFWSGTPDLGSSSRADKDALMQRLAGWAGSNHALVHAPGLLVLQDRSADVGQRYAWVEALSGERVVADPALQSYAQVRSLTAVGVELVGGAAYVNMASLGFYLPYGAAGLSLDAVGSTGTSVGGQVVLMTAPGGNTGSARVWTNKDDYVPDEMVLMLGSGFEPGETIALELMEDPAVHHARSFTVTADANGAFVFDEFRPEEHHLGVRFVLTATGQTSGVRAQTTFTDGIVLASHTMNQNGDPFTSELTIARPAVLAGDLMIAQVVLDNFGGTDVICAPTGWTSIGRTQNSSATIQHLFYRVAASNESATPSYTFRFRASSCSGSSLAKGAAGGIVAYRGVDTGHAGGPIVTWAGGVSSSTTITAPNITNVPAGSRVVRFFGDDKEMLIATSGTGTSTIYSLRRVKSGGFEKPSAAVADGEQATTGTTTTVTASNGGNGGNWVAQTVVVRVSPCTTPVVTSQPANATVAYGDDAIFTVAASGSPAPSVQWQSSTDAGVNWTNVPGATAASLTVTRPSVASSSTQYRAIFTNDCGSATSNAAVLTVSARVVTGTFTAADKVYDGNTSASITGRSLDGVLAGDDVSLSGGSASFADRNAGANKAVSGSGFTLAGADRDNYTLGQVSDAAASITALAITGSFTAADKVYDGTDLASITGGSLTGVLGTDDVSLAGGSATFADRNVGTNKLVTGFGFTLAGADAGNYSLSGVGTASASISALSITGSFTAADKIYDGNTSATITGRSLEGALAGDDVSLSGGTASFGDAAVGQNKAVTGSGFALSGNDSGNYLLTSVSNTTASITALALSGSFTAEDRVYDGTTAATVASTDLQGVAGTDQVTLVVSNAQFDSKHAGSNKNVTASLSLTGADAGNHSVNASYTAQASITALALTGSFTAADRPYDGTRNATVSSTSLPGSVAGDDVTLVVSNALFDTKEIGTGKDVTGELSLSGDDAGNYTVNASHTTQAAITAVALAGSFTAEDRVYDGTRDATVASSALSGVLAGEDVQLLVGSALFDTKDVGTSKDVVAALSLTGADAGNYTVNATFTAQASITPKALTGSFTADDKVYDGTTAATAASTDLQGVISPDQVVLVVSGAAFDVKDVGANRNVTAALSLSGADAGNYTVNASFTTQASITARALSGSFTASDKVYDRTRTATVASMSLPGVVIGDDVVLVVTGAEFDSKDVGSNRDVTGSLSLSGADAGNYSVNASYTAQASITPKPLSGSFTAADKVYDGTTAAAVEGTSLVGVIDPDQVSLVVSNAQFDTRHAGTGKDVTASLSLAGADAGNYSVNASYQTQASITALALVGSFTAFDKPYDGTRAATVATRSLPGTIAGDDVTLVVSNALFDTKDVGSGKDVTGELSLSGADAGNYSVNVAHTTQASITALVLAGSFTAEDKVYDGTRAATLSGSALSGVLDGEHVQLAVGTALFDSKHVGASKDVTASLSLTGADASNYTVNASYTAQASITALALAGSFTADGRVYDGTRAASVASVSLPGVVDGDDVALVVSNAQFDTKDVGTDKDVTGELSLSGDDAGNYTVNASHTTQASITALALVGSFTADSRVYDGTRTASVASVSLPGTVEGDDVALVVSNPQFDTKDVGTDKEVTGELSLSGADAGNYSVNSSHTTLASITARELTGSFTASDRVYDGTTAATVASTDLQGVLDPDQVTLVVSNAQFDTKDVGSNKDVSGELSLSGADAGNYSVNGSYTAQASITAKALTASFTANNKVYDGTTAATVASTDLPGVVAGDGVELVVGNAQFDTKDVGTNRNVTADLSLTGADAGNYTVNASHTTQASITAKALTVTAASASKNLGEPDPYFGVVFDGFVDGEDESVLGGYVAYTFRGVSPTSYGPSTTPPQRRGSYSIRPSGLTSSNYAITFVDGYYAVSGATFLFLDDEAIRKGSPPSGFTAPSFTDADLNESKTRIGQRDPLAWFNNPANFGKVIDLPSGQVGDEGWFTMKTVPASWVSAGPTNNGLRNLLRAGPGLGGGTDREKLLDKVRDVTPLRATGLELLEGSTVCAIVWKSDISMNYGPLSGSLKGDNRGIIAFEVVSVTRHGSGSTLPRVSVRVMDPSTTSGVCSEPLAMHTDAPAPTSSSSPMDVNPW